jgi:hypothetical protein
MLQLSSLLRGCCMVNRPFVATSKAGVHQSAPRRVCTGAPHLAAVAATSQHRQMGWPWPFRNSNSSSSGSRLQQLLEAATVFSHQPSAEALQDVKAALSGCLNHHAVDMVGSGASAHATGCADRRMPCTVQRRCHSRSWGCRTQPHSLTSMARQLQCGRSIPSATSTCES